MAAFSVQEFYHMGKNIAGRYKAYLKAGSRHFKTILWNRERWTAGEKQCLNFWWMKPLYDKAPAIADMVWHMISGMLLVW